MISFSFIKQGIICQIYNLKISQIRQIFTMSWQVIWSILADFWISHDENLCCDLCNVWIFFYESKYKWTIEIQEFLDDFWEKMKSSAPVWFHFGKFQIVQFLLVFSLCSKMYFFFLEGVDDFTKNVSSTYSRWKNDTFQKSISSIFSFLSNSIVFILPTSNNDSFFCEKFCFLYFSRKRTENRI